MNERQSQELEALIKLEADGLLEEAQKERFEELKTLKSLAEKTADGEKKSKDLSSALAQKDHFREKAEKAEIERKALEEKLNALSKGGNSSKAALDVEDYIDISTSLEGLDQKEKERISREHKLSGKSLSEIRKDEDFLLWQTAYRARLEKEKLTLAPSSKQPDANTEISIDQALSEAKTVAEKEQILANAGLYHESRVRKDRVVIGG